MTVYTWFLRAYPRSFREAYGEEMILLVCERLRVEHPRGLAATRFWAGIVCDTVAGGVRQQVAVAASERHRWVGSLALVGGVVWVTVSLTTQTAGGIPLAWVGIAFVFSLVAVLPVPGALRRRHQDSMQGSLTVLLLGLATMTAGFIVYVVDQLAGDVFADDLWWAPFMVGFFFVVPAGLVWLGVDVVRHQVMPVWVRPVPVVMGLAGLTNGIIAVHRPMVAVLVVFGVGWALIGVALRSSDPTSPTGQDQQPETLLTQGGSNA